MLNNAISNAIAINDLTLATRDAHNECDDHTAHLAFVQDLRQTLATQGQFTLLDDLAPCAHTEHEARDRAALENLERELERAAAITKPTVVCEGGAYYVAYPDGTFERCHNRATAAYLVRNAS